jgi:hypothetical protein
MNSLGHHSLSMHPILLSSQHSPGIQQRSELPVNANLLYLSLMYVLACTILLQKKLFKMSREAKESKRNYGNKWETSESKKNKRKHKRITNNRR